MSILSVASLVDEVARATVPLKSKSVGNYVGRFGKFGLHCWEVKEAIRTIYCTDIRPLILQHLDGRIGSVSTQGSITISVYMIGRRPNTAMPTVLFVSENESHRKEARKLIKDSGILGQHRGWKTAQASEDPSWGGELEQLASGSSLGNAGLADGPAIQVLYDPAQPLRSRGMTLYIPHDSGLRIITANLMRAHGKVYYQGPAHAFFDRIDKSSTKSGESVDDFEIDSDDETETLWADDETIACSTTELGYQDPETWSSSDESVESDSFSAEDSDDDNFSQSSVETVGLETTPNTTTYEGTIETTSLQFPGVKSPALAAESYLPALNSLQPFGALSQWSTDKDWALVEVLIATKPSVSAFLAAGPEDLSTMKIARPSSAGATVVTHTTSSGTMTGTISGMPSDTCIPYGASFQEVFSVRLDGPLADGDCGSVVIDAITGELYGHIVAGCRATGFAYVMAASHAMPDLCAALLSSKSVPTMTPSASDLMPWSPSPAMLGSSAFNDLFACGSSVPVNQEIRRETVLYGDPSSSALSRPSRRDRLLLIFSSSEVPPAHALFRSKSPLHHDQDDKPRRRQTQACFDRLVVREPRGRVFLRKRGRGNLARHVEQKHYSRNTVTVSYQGRHSVIASGSPTSTLATIWHRAHYQGRPCLSTYCTHRQDRQCSALNDGQHPGHYPYCSHRQDDQGNICAHGEGNPEPDSTQPPHRHSSDCDHDHSNPEPDAGHDPCYDCFSIDHQTADPAKDQSISHHETSQWLCCNCLGGTQQPAKPTKDPSTSDYESEHWYCNNRNSSNRNSDNQPANPAQCPVPLRIGTHHGTLRNTPGDSRPGDSAQDCSHCIYCGCRMAEQAGDKE